MMSVVALYVLVVLDAALSGFRAAGGRNPLIHKRRYQAIAQVRGIFWCHIGIASIALLVSLLLVLHENPSVLARELTMACGELVVVFVSFAMIFVVSLVLRIVPSVDVRTILNIVVFGPSNLLRPVIGTVGVGWAYLAVPRWQVIVIGLFGIFVMLALEGSLDRWYGKHHSHQFTL